MSRFNHLELGDDPPIRDDGEPVDAVIDQRYYVEKAVAAFDDEDYERALAYYSRALQYDINLEDAWLGQLRCLIELKELTEAITWSNRALERFPNSPQILAARGVTESRAGASRTAMAFIDSAFAGRGVTPYVWAARGEVLIPLNEANARACFAKAVEMAPSDWRIRVSIARSYIVHRCHLQALQQLRDAILLNPQSMMCHFWIGRCCQILGENEEARRAYVRALTIRPTFLKARDALDALQNRGTVSRIAGGIKRLFTGGQGRD